MNDHDKKKSQKVNYHNNHILVCFFGYAVNPLSDVIDRTDWTQVIRLNTIPFPVDASKLSILFVCR